MSSLFSQMFVEVSFWTPPHYQLPRKKEIACSSTLYSFLCQAFVCKHHWLLEETRRSYSPEIQTFTADRANDWGDDWEVFIWTAGNSAKMQQEQYCSSGRRTKAYVLEKARSSKKARAARACARTHTHTHACTHTSHSNTSCPPTTTCWLVWNVTLHWHRVTIIARWNKMPHTLKPSMSQTLLFSDWKMSNGHFTTEAKICVMPLVGDKEASAHRCGTIIQADAKHLSGARVPNSNLLSRALALRFVNQGPKSQVAGILVNGDHWPHSDGTSQCGKKYEGEQVTIQGGSFSTGITPVASGYTTIFVNISTQMLEELSDLYPQGQAQQNLIRILAGLWVVMTVQEGCSFWLLIL